MSRLLVSSAVAMIALAACGGSSPMNPTDDDDDGSGGPSQGSMTAMISDTAFAADTLIITLNSSQPGALVIAGTDFVGLTGSKSIQLNLAYLAGPATLPLGVNILTNAGGGATLQIVAGSSATSYNTPMSGAAGTLTVTSLTATRLVATFSFTADPVALGFTRNVTSGALDIALPTGFAPAPATNRGSRISATINGQPWNGATVLGTGNLGAGTISLGGSNTVYSVLILPFPSASVDSLSIAAGEVSVAVQLLSASQFWGGPGSTGSVTFTSLGNNYATGTFDGILTASGGGATGTLTISGGTFETRFAP
ncbi:MAG: hypothetical protein AB7T31_10990 [Gemmatimonadales bacterium]